MKKILGILFFLSTLSALAQPPAYVLDLKAEPWFFKPDLFYISAVVDDRQSKLSPGKVLVDNKFIDAGFKISLEADIHTMISGSAEQDQTQIPLILAFDKFEINETGTREHHKITFQFVMKFYREINGKRYLLYEVNGKPEMDIRGPYPNAHEKNIRDAIRRGVDGLNKWLNENPNQPLLARRSIVIMEPISKLKAFTGDTLFWSKGYQLKWSDFKGAPDKDSPFMAQSNCLFTFRVEPLVNTGMLELHLNMHSGFDRNTSWVKPGQDQEALLAHEQLHFDICEMFIRQLRNKILSMELDLIEYDTQIKMSFESSWNAYQLEQQRYDDETDHGLKTAIQQQWQTDVKNKLLTLTED